jgi:hypothetical protein
LYVCPVYLSVSCLVVHDQTTHRQVHRTHIQIEGIRPHTKKTNDEAGSRKVVNAVSTKETPEDGHRIRTETCRIFNDAFTKHVLQVLVF